MGPTRSRKIGAWSRLYVGIVAVLAGLAAALAFSFVAIGITSIGYYGPPLSAILSFMATAVEVCAAAGAFIVALIALLRKTKTGRSATDTLFENW